MSRVAALRRLLTNAEALKVRSAAQLVHAAELSGEQEIVSLGEQLDAQIEQIGKTKVLADSVGNLKHSTYTAGQEDAVPEPNFDFYRKHMKDKRFLSMVEDSYAKFLEHQKTETVKVPEEWSQLEEVVVNLHQEHDKKYAKLGDHLTLAEEEIKEIKSTRDNFEKWSIDDVLARNPKWAEKINNDMANENWEVRNDHD